MLPTTALPSSPTPQGGESRAERRCRLLQQLHEAAAPLLEQMADTLVDAPDRELFRAAELRLRDLGQQLAAAAQQTGLDDRKKGATEAPASSAPIASTTPAASSNVATTSSASMAP
jgi:hypothetical protein